VDVFQADLAAYADWWLVGGRKPRAQSTLAEYQRHIRHWWAWTTESQQTCSTTPTVRGVNAYIRVLRQRNEHAVVGFVRAIKSWCLWLVDDGAITEDPLATLGFVKSPKPDPANTPVADDLSIEAQLATCDTSMEGQRDRAIIMVLRDTGMRRGELALMTWDNLDLQGATVYLPNENTKSNVGRRVGIEVDTVRSIHRYRRALLEWENKNARYPCERVWVGRFGPMSSNGIGQMLHRRSEEACVRAPAHSYRRGLATKWLAAGGSETNLMRIAGWSTPLMIARYTATNAEVEAIEAQRTFNASQRASQRRRAVRTAPTLE